MTDQSAKERVQRVLVELQMSEYIGVNEALSQIEEIVKEVIGEPTSSFEPVKIAEEETIARQLKRWSGNIKL